MSEITRYDVASPDALSLSLTGDLVRYEAHLAALRRAKAEAKLEGLREAEQHAMNCLKELQHKIGQLAVGKLAQADVEEWVDAKALQASRIAKWITARIAEVEADARAAQIEEGAGGEG